MDINLPLILLIAVTASGLIWLFDLVFLKPTRDKALLALDGEFEGYSDEEKNADANYTESKERITTDHVIVEYAKSFFPVLFIVFFLRSFIVEPFQIPSESMVPTLEVGDFILVNKFTYGIRLPVARTKVIPINQPERGEVMVFFPPHESRYFIKRVVGLPGDKIREVNNVLYINGEEVLQKNSKTEALDRNDPCGRHNGRYIVSDEYFDDSSSSHKMRKCVVDGLSARERSWVVPEGHYFMMGDNRDNSSDSRVWGPVPEDRIVGKAFAIWMHWDSLFSIPSFSRVGTI